MAAILKCEGKLDEMVMIELQSYAMMEDGSSLCGNFLGELVLHAGNKVTLTNGPRTLTGKLVELPKPLVVMEKTGKSEGAADDENRRSEIFAAHGVVRRKAVFNSRPQLSV
eukprot:TRINITY_DN25382_c0_g1_i1.p1 TRINITY_DN25382_c0_g1~~TRINITY_DN25382_c0_g1_i1.p1  ORF type:complete len:111 (+),score=25.96 TRINITY_DN25382_c0_g1_i1:95-427(+)